MKEKARFQISSACVFRRFNFCAIGCSSYCSWIDSSGKLAACLVQGCNLQPLWLANKKCQDGSQETEDHGVVLRPYPKYPKFAQMFCMKSAKHWFQGPLGCCSVNWVWLHTCDQLNHFKRTTTISKCLGKSGAKQSKVKSHKVSIDEHKNAAISGDSMAERITELLVDVPDLQLLILLSHTQFDWALPCRPKAWKCRQQSNWWRPQNRDGCPAARS